MATHSTKNRFTVTVLCSLVGKSRRRLSSMKRGIVHQRYEVKTKIRIIENTNEIYGTTVALILILNRKNLETDFQFYRVRNISF